MSKRKSNNKYGSTLDTYSTKSNLKRLNAVTCVKDRIWENKPLPQLLELYTGTDLYKNALIKTFERIISSACSFQQFYNILSTIQLHAYKLNYVIILTVQSCGSIKLDHTLTPIHVKLLYHIFTRLDRKYKINIESSGWSSVSLYIASGRDSRRGSDADSVYRISKVSDDFAKKFIGNRTLLELGTEVNPVSVDDVTYNPVYCWSIYGKANGGYSGRGLLYRIGSDDWHFATGDLNFVRFVELTTGLIYYRNNTFYWTNE